LSRGPQVGDLVKFDLRWADTHGPDNTIAGPPIRGDKNNHWQYGIVTSIQKRTRRAWDQYIIEWNGEDLLFFGNDDKIIVVGDED